MIRVPRLIVGAVFYAMAYAMLAGLPSTMSQEIKFKKLQLDREFRSEGVTAFDVNKDGKVDIVTDQFWYEAPNWKPHEIRTPQSWEPEHNYSVSFCNFPGDVNGDGFTDLIVAAYPGEPMHWYENPRGKDSHWQKHELFRSAANESPTYLDLLGNGKRVMIMGVIPEKILAWFNPDTDPTKPWLMHPISGPNAPGADRFSHGFGVGDINGDGRLDIVISSGWYEAPVDRAQPDWKFRPVNFSPEGCAQMYVYDVNGDGRPDVIGSNPHQYGVWWWEQGPSEAGKEPTWTQHVIDNSFSETHAMRFEDLDGDGIPEIITGKRFYSHGKGEKGSLDPALLVYYKLKRNGSQIEWVRHDIDNDSGVGTQFEVTDVNGDGKLDIIISNKKGLFYFEQQ